jgi:hypothetical protein
MKGNSLRRLVIMMALMWVVNVVVKAEDSPPPSFPPLVSRTVLHLPPPSGDGVGHYWNVCKEICTILSGKRNLITRKEIYKSYFPCVVRCLTYFLSGTTW